MSKPWESPGFSRGGAVKDQLPMFETCPHCGRDVGHTLVHCDQYAFPVRGACPEHGEVLPMRRVVANEYPGKS